MYDLIRCVDILASTEERAVPGASAEVLQYCTAEWLWIDVLAMHEVYEDMSEAEKERTEEMRVQIINRYRGVYERADQVIVLDGLLLRLHTGSMIDVAVILALSRWMSRLWCFMESWLARSVVLKTADAAFDFDELLDLLFKTVNNEEHRYSPRSLSSFASTTCLGRGYWLYSLGSEGG